MGSDHGAHALRQRLQVNEDLSFERKMRMMLDKWREDSGYNPYRVSPYIYVTWRDDLYADDDQRAARQDRTTGETDPSD